MTFPTLPSTGQQPGNVDFNIGGSGTGQLEGTQSSQNLSLDSISSTDWVTIAQYMDSIAGATNDLRSSLYDISVNTPLLYKSAYAGLSEQIFAAIANANAIYNLMVALNAAQTTLQNQINAYNNAVNIATSELDIAITVFNSIVPATSLSKANLQSAIDNYQNTVNPLTLAINAKIQGYNNNLGMYQAAVIRSETAAGQPINPLLPLGLSTVFTDYSVPNNPPMGTINDNPTPGVPGPVTINNPVSVSILLAYLIPQFKAISQNTTNIQQFISNLIAYSIKNAELNAGDPTLPLAFIQRIPHALFEGQGNTAIGSSVQLLSLATGNCSPTMGRILSRAAYQVVYLQANRPLPASLKEQLEIFNTQLIGNTAGPAALAAAQQLSSKPVGPGNTGLAFDAISGLSYAGYLRDVVNSNIISDGVAKLVNGDPEASQLTAAQKQDLITILTAISGLTLLTVALAQVAQALQLPGLPGQLINNINGLKDLQNAGLGSTLSIILEDPLAVIFIKLNLIGQIASIQEIPKETATLIANTVVNSALAAITSTGSGTITPQEFREAVLKAATEYGASNSPGASSITPSVASAIADSAATFVNTEVALPFLNLPFIPSTIASVSSSAAASQPSLTDVLTATIVASNPELFAPASTKAFVGRSVTEALQRNEGTSSGFSTQLSSTLIEQGVSPATAGQVSNQAVAFVNGNRGNNRSFDHAVQAAMDGTAATPSLPASKVELSNEINTLFAGNPSFESALNNAVAANPATIRELRDGFLTELAIAGVDVNQAQSAANQVATLAAPAPDDPKVLPFFHRAPTAAALPPPDLAEIAIEYIIHTLGPRLGEIRAREIANQAVHTLISSNSILSTYNEQFRILREENQQRVLDEFASRTVPAVVTPNTPIYSLTGHIGGLVRSQVDIIQTYMDPAARASLMNSNIAEEPLGFRDLEIRI